MNPTEPMIRIIVASDEAELQLVKQLFKSYAEEFADTIAEALCLQGFAAEIDTLPGRYAPPSGCLLLAMAAEVPAGCVALRDRGNGFCEIKRLYVVPTERTRGTGGKLVKEVVRRAELLGYNRIVLDTVPEMIRALSLYQKHGFQITKPDWEHTGDHAIFMEKRLADDGTRPHIDATCG